MSGNSVASVFYWSIYKRGDTGENTDGPIAHNIKTIWTDAN